MDKTLVGMSNTDKIVPHGLVNYRAGFIELFMVPSSVSNGDSYGDDCGSKAQEALCVAHHSVPAVDDKLLEDFFE